VTTQAPPLRKSRDTFGGDDFFNRLIFGDESTFHVGGKVNKHNVRVWGTENPWELVQYLRDSPNINVFCAASRTKVYGPFFSMKTP
jgi:hypothetical protein